MVCTLPHAHAPRPSMCYYLCTGVRGCIGARLLSAPCQHMRYRRRRCNSPVANTRRRQSGRDLGSRCFPGWRRRKRLGARGGGSGRTNARQAMPAAVTESPGRGFVTGALTTGTCSKSNVKRESHVALRPHGLPPPDQWRIAESEGQQRLWELQPRPSTFQRQCSASNLCPTTKDSSGCEPSSLYNWTWAFSSAMRAVLSASPSQRHCRRLNKATCASIACVVRGESSTSGAEVYSPLSIRLVLMCGLQGQRLRQSEKTSQLQRYGARMQ
jgi:hypothetical protein